MLYFAALVDKLGHASEEVELPAVVADVQSLLSWLRERGGNWERALRTDAVRVTVNKQFALPQTTIDNTSEIALVSAHPW